MPEYRVTFVDKATEEQGSRRWPSEIEARAYIAGLWRGGSVNRVRLLEVEKGSKPVPLALKRVDSHATLADVALAD